MEKKDKANIFIIILFIVTLLTLIIGATFAWFTASVTGNETASSVIVQTGTVGINFTDGNEIVLRNAKPGDSGSKEFTVESSAEANMLQQYSINWDISTFNFDKPDELVYSIEGETNKDGKVVNVKDKPMPTTIGVSEVAEGTIKPEEVHTYTLTIKYIDNNHEQSVNNGKQFYGKIKITADKIRYAIE